MSHQIKRLRCTVLTAGWAGGNFPSTIYAQSSTWGPAATPAQPTRAFLIGWLLRPRQNGETRRPCARDYRSIPSHLLAVSPGRSMGPALKLDGAQRKVGRLASCFLCSVRFSHFPARTVEKESISQAATGAITGQTPPAPSAPAAPRPNQPKE